MCKFDSNGKLKYFSSFVEEWRTGMRIDAGILLRLSAMLFLATVMSLISSPPANAHLALFTMQSPGDKDGDGIPDELDPVDDRDIPDNPELPSDSDDDGILDELDPHDDSPEAEPVEETPAELPDQYPSSDTVPFVAALPATGSGHAPHLPSLVLPFFLTIILVATAACIIKPIERQN